MNFETAKQGVLDMIAAKREFAEHAKKMADKWCSAAAELSEVNKELLKNCMAASRLEHGGYHRDVEPTDFDALVTAFDSIAKTSHMGLLLTGGVGCGKTLAIRSLVRGMMIRLTDRTEIESLLPTLNEATGRFTWRGMQGCNVILDDLGSDVPTSDYGIKVDPVSEYILRWYADKIEDGNKGRLFATSNLTGEQLRKRYGDRVADRLFSMVHVVAMQGTSKRPKPSVFGGVQ